MKGGRERERGWCFTHRKGREWRRHDEKCGEDHGEHRQHRYAGEPREHPEGLHPPFEGHGTNAFPIEGGDPGREHGRLPRGLERVKRDGRGERGRASARGRSRGRARESDVLTFHIFLYFWPLPASSLASAFVASTSSLVFSLVSTDSPIVMSCWADSRDLRGARVLDLVLVFRLRSFVSFRFQRRGEFGNGSAREARSLVRLGSRFVLTHRQRKRLPCSSHLVWLVLLSAR